MLWIYIVPSENYCDINSHRRTFKDYLNFYGYKVKDWDDSSHHVSLYIESMQYSWSHYTVGDIIYFFSQDEWDRSDIKDTAYRMDSDQVISGDPNLKFYRYVDKSHYREWCKHEAVTEKIFSKGDTNMNHKCWLYIYDRDNLRYDMDELIRYFKRMGGKLSIPKQSDIIVSRPYGRVRISYSHVIDPADCFKWNDYIYFVLPDDIAQVTLQLDQQGETFAFAPYEVIKKKIKQYYEMKKAVGDGMPVYDTAVAYSISDVKATFDIWKYEKEYMGLMDKFEIKDVIFNEPATIVLWADGTKTVVKCQGKDKFDPEKGLAMCFAKKALGNNMSYYETFAKYVGRYNKKLAKAAAKKQAEKKVPVAKKTTTKRKAK